MTAEQALDFIDSATIDRPNPDADFVAAVREAAKAPTRRTYYLFMALAALAAMGRLDSRRAAVFEAARLTVCHPGDPEELTAVLIALAQSDQWETVLATAFMGLLILPEGS